MKVNDKLICPICNNSFLADRNNVFTTRHQPNKINYCSYKCAYKGKITKLEVKCTQCGKSIKKVKSSVTKNNFCNHSCATTYQNTHKTKGYRRSKLEIWLETQLLILYPKLKFKFNSKDEINSELDIFIPFLKLAFELNGIFHYEPIFGKDKLDKTQNNDKRKFQACLENNIELCIIDVSKITYLKSSTAQPILNIIQNIINKKLQYLDSNEKLMVNSQS